MPAHTAIRPFTTGPTCRVSNRAHDLLGRVADDGRGKEDLETVDTLLLCGSPNEIGSDSTLTHSRCGVERIVGDQVESDDI